MPRNGALSVSGAKFNIGRDACSRRVQFCARNHLLIKTTGAFGY